MRFGSVSLLVGLLLACGTEKGGGETGEPWGTVTETIGATTGEPLPAGCECAAPACSQQICPAVWYDEGSCSESKTTEEALRCAVEALRDRKPGTIRWTYRSNCGEEQRDVSLTIFADGTAWSSEVGQGFGYEYEGPVSLGSLRPVDYFADCLGEEPDAHSWYLCLRQAILDGETVCAGKMWLTTSGA